MPKPEAYRIVRLANGAHSIHSVANGETFHPVVGPAREAEALYVRQLRLAERLRAEQGDFAVWDIGLGAAANPITLLRATREIAASLCIVSFDSSLEPLDFALRQKQYLPYLAGYEAPLENLLRNHFVRFKNGLQTVTWTMHLADFPALLATPEAQQWPKPHAIMFDAFSPATNPAMWTEPVFAGIYRLLDPARPCALPTYSRSTMLRVTLLLAGFFVGVGQPTGQKEETTIAANKPELLSEPLDRRWLLRAHRSSSAEPMWEPVYRQARLSPKTWEALQQHPQFRA